MNIIQVLSSVIIIVVYLGVFIFFCWMIVGCINHEAKNHKEKKEITGLGVLITVAATVMAMYAISVFKAVLD